jgi:NhaP-type Na+/H+ or K+/H+ antiporter
MRLIWSQKSLLIWKPVQSARKTKMDKTQIITLVLGSAAIGALVSSAITLIGQALERKHRRGEMLLHLSADFAKLLFAHKVTGLGFAQLSLVGQYYSVLDEVLKHGKNSPAMEKELNKILDEFDPDKQKKRKDSPL